MARRTSVVKSIRISREMDRLLQEEIEERNLTLNTFIMQLLVKYFQWDKYAERMGLTQLPRELYSDLLSLMQPERFSEFVAKNVQATKDSVLVRFGEFNLVNLLKWFSLVFKYSWQANTKWEQRMEGKTCVLTLRHNFGENWSEGWRQFMSMFLKDFFGINKVEVEKSPNLVVVKFEYPQIMGSSLESERPVLSTPGN